MSAIASSISGPGCNDSAPVVLVTFCAKGDAGEVRGGIFNAFLSQIVALKAVGVRVVAWTASASIAAAAREVGADETWADRSVRSGYLPFASPGFWGRARRLRRGNLRASIHNSGRTWLWAEAFFPGLPHAQVLHRHRLGNYRWFRCLIALSDSFAAEVRGQFPNKRIAVAPNGLRPDVAILAAPRPVAGQDGADSPLRIAALGRPAPTKGFDVLLEAVASLRRGGTDVRLSLGGVQERDYASFLEDPALSGAVTVTRAVHDVAAFMDACDVFCLPSRLEPFGLVLLEAMARGRPVVATQTAGPLEIVTDGETGLLTAIGDAEALADALRRLANDRALVRRLGENGLRRMREQYAPEAIGKRLVAALEEIGADIALAKPDKTTPSAAKHLAKEVPYG